MFRKIRSNRAPEKTVWADLRDELAPYFIRIYHTSSSLVRKFPRTIFLCMVISLIYSILWSFSSGLAPKSKNNPPVSADKDIFQDQTVIKGGLNSISRAAGELRRTMAIRDKVDSVLNKKNLSGADSVFLENALLELKQIQQP